MFGKERMIKNREDYGRVCKSARGKDRQLQECLGIRARPGCAIKKKIWIPVIEMLSIPQNNGDSALTENDKVRGEQLLRSLIVTCVLCLLPLLKNKTWFYNILRYCTNIQLPASKYKSCLFTY